MLISADLFCCGLVTLVQSLGMTRWFGIKLPVMMGVTFAAVGPMVAFANAMPGVDGARAIFGAIIGAGIVSMLIAPVVSRLLRFFPAGGHRHHHRDHRHQPDARGRGLGDGRPGQPMAQSVDVPKLVAMVHGQGRSRGGGRAGCTAPVLPGPIPMVDNPNYGALDNMAIAGGGAGVHPAAGEVHAKGFVANIAVLLGIVAGCAVAIGLGKMNFDKVGKANVVRRGHAVCVRHADLRHPVMILTMVLVMIVVMIESTGMFLALSDLTGRKVGQPTTNWPPACAPTAWAR